MEGIKFFAIKPYRFRLIKHLQRLSLHPITYTNDLPFIPLLYFFVDIITFFYLYFLFFGKAFVLVVFCYLCALAFGQCALVSIHINTFLSKCLNCIEATSCKCFSLYLFVIIIIFIIV